MRLGDRACDEQSETGTRLRAATAYLGAAVWDSRRCHSIEWPCGGPFLLGLVGLSGIVSGTIADLIEAPRSARAYNLSHEPLRVFPFVVPTSGGPAAGLAVGGAF